jgi:hypothetical protein
MFFAKGDNLPYFSKNFVKVGKELHQGRRGEAHV